MGVCAPCRNRVPERRKQRLNVGFRQTVTVLIVYGIVIGVPILLGQIKNRGAWLGFFAIFFGMWHPFGSINATLPILPKKMLMPATTINGVHFPAVQQPQVDLTPVVASILLTILGVSLGALFSSKSQSQASTPVQTTSGPNTNPAQAQDDSRAGPIITEDRDKDQ
jgi:hypothetical protein